MAEIRVEVVERRTDETLVRVQVRDPGGETTHLVTVRERDRDRLAGATPPEDLVRAAFEFLLAREPKESIFRAFDLATIRDYFHVFDREMMRRFGLPWPR